MENENIMTPLKFAPIGEIKKEKSVSSAPRKIRKVEQTRIKKSQIALSLKKIALMASIGSAITLTAGYGATTGLDNIIEHYKINKEFNTLNDDARDILNKNSNMVYTQRDGENVWENQYDHQGIAQSIKKIESNYGEVSADALTAMLMASIEESGYRNMDQIIRYLVEDQNIKTVEDYIHSQGYETEEAYQRAMKEAYYEEMQKNEVRANYFNEEGRSR